MSRKVSHSSDLVGCFFDQRLDRLFFHDGAVSDVGVSLVFFIRNESERTRDAKEDVLRVADVAYVETWCWNEARHALYIYMFVVLQPSLAR